MDHAVTKARSNLPAPLALASEAFDDAQRTKEVMDYLRRLAKESRDYREFLEAIETLWVRRREAVMAYDLSGAKATGTQGTMAGRDTSGAPKLRAPEKGAPTLKQLGLDHRLLSAWRKRVGHLDEEEFATWLEAEKQRTIKMLEKTSIPHVANNSGNNEWYTPAEYIRIATDVMGAIDLDPASSEIANRVVKAAMFFSAEDDGLRHPWMGRVWMNPPYAQPLIGQFCSRLKSEKGIGNVTQFVVLVNNATETEWFSDVVSVASAVVFPGSRVKFWNPDGAPGAPLQGQALIYGGGPADGFLEIAASIGWGARIA